MPESSRNFSTIILAGGRSSRMGASKAELTFGDKTMLERIVDEMARFSDDVMIAASASQPFLERGSIRILADTEKYRGPVIALESRLREIRNDAAFVCSCDVPFVSGDLSHKLCEMLGDYDALVPQVEGKLQTLHAVYRKSCAKIFATMRAAKEDRLHEIVNFAKVRIVPAEEIRAIDPDPRMLSFFNVNTPEDYQRALQLMAERDKK